MFEQPLEVKRRVGYIPETPPLYPDMDVDTFLDFCAKIKGVPNGERKARIDDAVEKCRVGDVRRTLIGRLSKGYRQRVGLAQAILANPDVLILDEPTAGLDPKQIIETRELIKGLGGDHTIILSTHILPEVSMTCGRVVIINKGKVVAEDTPDNLMHRLKGAATLRVEVRGDAQAAEGALRGVPGVLAVRPPGPSGSGVFEVEAAAGADVRADVARAVIGKGLDLVGLTQAGMSLEEIFLHLTTSEPVHGDVPPPTPEVSGVNALRNVSALVEKEWRHYFGSPIAYVALTMWTLLFGAFHVLIFRQFLLYSMRSAQQRVRRRAEAVAQRARDRQRAPEHGGGGPLHHPHAHHAAVRGGEAPGDARAPRHRAHHRRCRSSLGKFLGALSLFALMIAAGLLNFLLLWQYATVPPEWKPVATGALALLLLGACFIAVGLFVSTLTREPDRRRHADLRPAAGPLDPGLAGRSVGGPGHEVSSPTSACSRISKS